MKKILFLFLFFIQSIFVFSQCFDASNEYSFNYGGHKYSVVKENVKWEDASNCAVSEGGYLVEINSMEEQNSIFSKVVNNANITASKTLNRFGTAAVWIGGSDAQTEGTWIWDGDNDDIGNQFWQGGPNGHSIDGAYSNWGVIPAEPDNSGNQDKLTLTIASAHPNFGKWNDLSSNNSNKLYYIIEYGTNLSVKEDVRLRNEIIVYPNPFDQFVNIQNNSHLKLVRIEIINYLGQNIYLNNNLTAIEKIGLPNLKKGIYFLNIYLDNGNSMMYKISR